MKNGAFSEAPSMTEANARPASIGVVGLGIMGSSIARHLAAVGRLVIGYDTDPRRLREAEAVGVAIAASTADLAARADLVLTSLPGATALDATVDAILSGPHREGLIVAELSTLSLEDKLKAHARLADGGVAMLDCPISGTGAQAANRDIVLYVSGEQSAFERSRAAFADFSRDSVYLGAFGNGTRMKLVANLLVAIHNVAAAEALLLAVRAGLEPENLVKVLGSGAGGSRMLDLRGPMMLRNVFEPATMKLDVWQKDMRLIEEFAAAVGVATPLFSATAPLYERALRSGRGSEDTAAVYTVLEEMAGPAR
jgi:putative dehydrogenase